MKNETQHFCEELGNRFEVLTPLLKEHIADYDEILPHVFMAEVTRLVLSERSQRMEIVRELNGAFCKATNDIQDLIAVSFVENIESIEQLDRALYDVSADALRAEWFRQHQ